MLVMFKVEIPACVALDQGERPLYRYAICPIFLPSHKSILYVQLHRTSPSDSELTHCRAVTFIPNENSGVREHAGETR
jgi:hypothetical protein